MSKLSEFLCENIVDGVTDEVTISNRIPFKFKITAMTNTQFNTYRKMATRIKGKSATFDTAKLTEQIVINHTVEPNFRNAEDIKKVGATTPEQYLNKVLLAGEVATLSEKIQELSGFDIDLDEAIEEAKN